MLWFRCLHSHMPFAKNGLLYSHPDLNFAYIFPLQCYMEISRLSWSQLIRAARMAIPVSRHREAHDADFHSTPDDRQIGPIKWPPSLRWLCHAASSASRSSSKRAQRSLPPVLQQNNTKSSISPSVPQQVSHLNLTSGSFLTWRSIAPASQQTPLLPSHWTVFELRSAMSKWRQD